MGMSRKLCMGILAHVDAGKTTLSEAMLYTCGQIRKLGRVDHGDAFLDNFSMERERGITIFSKQASFSWKECEITLLDTPGHVDFSAEMERTLQVLDLAVLVISGADGVQGHTKTLMRLLAMHEIPTFLFVNKMDQPGTDREALLENLRSSLDENCFDWSEKARAAAGFGESIALCSEELMEEFLEMGKVSEESLGGAIAKRQMFPVYFGSALKLDGVEELLDGIARFAKAPAYGENFAARVFKISRDAAGNRLTHMKITGGTLRVKQVIGNENSASSDAEIWQEKVDQIRCYEGASYKAVDEAEAGEIVTVTGLQRSFAGEGLGAEVKNETAVLHPVLTYRVILEVGTDPVTALAKFRELEEEAPELHVLWKEEARQIHVQVMGEVQLEILKRQLHERFGMEASFGEGSIVYLETIAAPVIGIGHFEPLRHYAEVHLLLEPGEPGSGLTFEANLPVDALERNWQRLILTHLEEKTHLGVLTGSPITDMRITLVNGKAHLKHTEGGDFRQATYRAVRQGLMRAKSVLLEPIYAFEIEVPTAQIGRAMTDIKKQGGSFETPGSVGEMSLLSGKVPVATMKDYPRELAAYTKGLGKLSLRLAGYEPCHNAEEVIAASGYDPERDLENPSSSVFCAHGAGFVVDWTKVGEYAHLESEIAGEETIETGFDDVSAAQGRLISHSARDGASQTGSGRSDYISQEEIASIFQQTYKKNLEDYDPYRVHTRNLGSGVHASEIDAASDASNVGGKESDADIKKYNKTKPQEAKKEYLLVDGYNMIFAWDELRALAESNIDSARDRLMDICCDYQGFMGMTLILVYDAYKVKGNPGSVLKYHNIYVVFTKEAETADAYIEKTVHEIGKKHRVTVATSDGLEQMIIWGEGATRLSAQGFRAEVEEARKRMREEYLS